MSNKQMTKKDIELSIFAMTAFVLIGFMLIPVIG